MASPRPGDVGPIPPPVAELHLRHPSMCRDESPFLVGQVLNPERVPLRRVQARRDGWTSELVAVEADHTFLVELSLGPRLSRFELIGFDEGGRPIALTPAELSITHGVSIGDPPVARSVGVARSSNEVMIYFERGDPLPAERSFQFFTVETVQARTDDCIRVPLVQGEYELAHLCQKIGEIVIDGRRIDRTIQTGSEVEITLRMDRGGHLQATARFPEHKVEVRSVARLLTPEADPAAMREELDKLGRQLEELRSQAFAVKDRSVLKRLTGADQEMMRLAQLVDGLAPEASESAQRARRDLLELSGEVFHLDQALRWPEVEEEIDETFSAAAYWVSSFGKTEEQRLLEKTHREVEAARARRSARRISRLLRRARNLMDACFQRSDAAVKEVFQTLASRTHEAKRPRKFRRLVERGRKAMEQDDMTALRNLNHQLSMLLPGRPDVRERAFSSGVE